MSFHLTTSKHRQHNTYFNGIAFSKSSIIMSRQGLIDYLDDGGSIFDLEDGRYSLFLACKDSSFLTTDRTGQDCWYYYEDNNYWSISNSFYGLCESLAKAGKNPRLRESSALAFNLPRSLGDQLSTNNTMAEGVKILPRDSFIEIKYNKLIVKKYREREEIEGREEYIRALKEYIFLWRSRIHTLSSMIGEKRVRCDISGGIDSRIVMALSNPNTLSGSIKYASNRLWKNDYDIAKLVSMHANIRLDNTAISPSRTLSVEESSELYLYGNAGIYRNMYFPNHFSSPRSLHLHGAGGGNIRGMQSGTAWDIVNRAKKFLTTRGDYNNFKSEYLSWFEDNNIDIKSSESTIQHYRNFRGRFHFGRNWFRSLTNPLVTPLSSISTEEMSDYLSRNNILPNMLQFDILYLCDPALALLPFDTKEKNFAKEHYSVSISYLSGVKTKVYEPKALRTYGAPQNDSKALPSGVSDKQIVEFIESDVKRRGADLPDAILRKFPFIRSDPTRSYGFVAVLETLNI